MVHNMDMPTKDELIEHDLIQGSDEWLAFRMNHDGSSEAAAMLGLSNLGTRTELLRMKSSGMTKEFSDWVQANILDYGHEVEALARPIVAQKLGIRLFPLTCSLGRLSASCDGLTMDGTIGWEHKQWNAALAAAVTRNELPDTHMPQVQQELLVTGAQKWIFTVSDGTPENMVSMEVLPDTEWFERILAGWEQFNKDRENYQHVEHAEKPKADAIMDLPALAVTATGMVTYSNLPEFKAAAQAYIANINTDLQTDQQFSDAEATVKFCKATEEKLEVTKSAILAQTASIDEVIRTVDHIQAQLRDKRLMLDKLVTKEKELRKTEIVSKAGLAFSAHVEALESETRPIQLNVQRPDFGGAIKGKKTLASMHDAVDTALANGKIAADAIAKDIRAKLAWCKENAAGKSMLFPDLAQIITKPLDDFTLTITSRIEKHKADEARKEAEIVAKAEADAAAKLEAQRAAIQAEEEAKATAKAQAEAETILAAERAKQAEQQNASRGDADISQVGARPALVQTEPAAPVAPVRTIDTPSKPVEKSAEIVHIGQSKRPSDTDIIRAITKEFGCTNGQACDWIIEMADNMKQAA